MIVNTRRAFARLLPLMQINTVCDIGSMNGADALMFSSVLRQATVYAFEPNPRNFSLMETDAALRSIHVVPFAATNYDGEAEFFLVQADYSSQHARRGMSSLYRRSDGSELAAIVPVKTTRLDTFLADKSPPDACLALWIDAEGKAYEVIEGAAGVARHVHLLHAEVETAPCIGANQKLYRDVKTLLHTLGFAQIATDRAPSELQFNALFVRRDLPMSTRMRVSKLLAFERLRRLVARAIHTACPACLRRLRAVLS